MTTLLVFKRNDDDRMLSLVQEENALMIIFRESEVKNIEIQYNEIDEQTMTKTLKYLASTMKFNHFELQMGGITIRQRGIDNRFEIGGVKRQLLFDKLEILP